MTNQLIHRQSAIITYWMCAEKYRRRYANEEFRSPCARMIRGSGVHGGAAHNFRQKKDSHQDLKKQDIVDKAVAVFDEIYENEGCTLAPEEKSRGKGIVIGEERDRVWRLSELQADDLAPTIQPVAVEQTIIADFPSLGFKVRGTLDLKDSRNVIQDLKSSTKKRPAADVHKDFQLTTYAALDFTLTKKMPAGLKLNVLVDKKRPELQILETARDMQDFETWFRTIKAVDAAIRAGIFPPTNKHNWWCSPKWCEYWADCIYWSESERSRISA